MRRGKFQELIKNLLKNEEYFQKLHWKSNTPNRVKHYFMLKSLEEKRASYRIHMCFLLCNWFTLLKKVAVAKYCRVSSKMHRVKLNTSPDLSNHNLPYISHPFITFHGLLQVFPQEQCIRSNKSSKEWHTALRLLIKPEFTAVFLTIHKCNSSYTIHTMVMHVIITQQPDVSWWDEWRQITNPSAKTRVKW